MYCFFGPLTTHATYLNEDEDDDEALFCEFWFKFRIWREFARFPGNFRGNFWDKIPARSGNFFLNSRWEREFFLKFPLELIHLISLYFDKYEVHAGKNYIKATSIVIPL